MTLAPPPSKYAHLSLNHPNGERKTREELEEEALEESWMPFLKRFFTRSSFFTRLLAVMTILWCFAKTLARLYVEIGVEHDVNLYHVGYWASIGFTAFISLLECSLVRTTSDVIGTWGRQRRQQQQEVEEEGGMVCLSSSLTEPLLVSSHLLTDENEDMLDATLDFRDAIVHIEEMTDSDEEKGYSSENDGGEGSGDNLNLPAKADITRECEYKAGWWDLFHMIAPDLHLIAAAFVFLLAAAIMQIYIPRLTGKALDALVDGGGNSSSSHTGGNIWSDSGFVTTIKQLVVASILGGVFAGIRGSIFTVIGGRVNVRLRIRLMESLLKQEIGFFDVTKTGDITSRLCSDTTLVGDQVSLNVNVFLRSTVQAVGVLIFMFFISWQLTLLTFVSVPAIATFSTFYGQFVRKLTKLMQKKVSDGSLLCKISMFIVHLLRTKSVNFALFHIAACRWKFCQRVSVEFHANSTSIWC